MSGEGGQSSQNTSSSTSFFSWATEVASLASEGAKELAAKAKVEATRLSERSNDWQREATASLKQGATEFVEKSQRFADDLSRKTSSMNSLNISEMVLGVNLSGSESGTGGKTGAISSRSRAQGANGGTALDMSYITQNIIQMSFPYDEVSAAKNGGNNVNVVADMLNSRHGGHYMIWNISEEAYDYNLFDNQVLEYKFPGHPSPPLGLMFNICTSIESWLDADEKNVAVVHCLTGKGRSASLLACVLTWLGEFTSPSEALQYIADRRNIAVDFLTIPSQRRYVQYFANMLDGVRPQPHHLLLRRAIMNAVPPFVQQREIPVDGQPGKTVIIEEPGCCPYIQLFKSGKMIATAVAVDHTDSGGGAGGDEDVTTARPAVTPEKDARDDSGRATKEDIDATPGPAAKAGGAFSSGRQRLELRWVPVTDGTTTFSLDCAVQGDVLLRCRHAEVTSGHRVSMFRAAFHTGYVPTGVLRLSKAQLDGAGADPRFSDNFFLDLIFAPIEPGSGSTTGSLQMPSDSGIKVDGEFSERYEQTLHRDVRFWEGISARKNKAKRRKVCHSRSSQTHNSSHPSLLPLSPTLASIIMKISTRNTNRNALIYVEQARKFVSTTHDQFSIGEERSGDSHTGGGYSQDTEIVFSGSPEGLDDGATRGGMDTLASTTTDLLAELAEFEGDNDEDHTVHSGRSSSSSSSSSNNDNNNNSSSSSSSDGTEKTTGRGRGSPSGNTPATPGGAHADTSPSSPSRDATVVAPDGASDVEEVGEGGEGGGGEGGATKLAALDALERELGINLSDEGVADGAATPKSTSESMKTPNQSAPSADITDAGDGDVSIEEEFDELEKYLESLATPSKA